MATVNHSFSDSAVEQFFEVKQRGIFVKTNGSGDVREAVITDPGRSLFRVYVWREAGTKHVRVLDYKDEQVYIGSVDL